MSNVSRMGRHGVQAGERLVLRFVCALLEGAVEVVGHCGDSIKNPNKYQAKSISLFLKNFRPMGNAWSKTDRSVSEEANKRKYSFRGRSPLIYIHTYILTLFMF